MKRYILLIALISFMPKLQAADPREKTLALQNLSEDNTYTVKYKTKAGQQVEVSLPPKEYKRLEHDFDQIQEIAFWREGYLALSHPIDMQYLLQLKSKFYHLLIAIEKGYMGYSTYKVAPDPKYYAEAALSGFIQGIQNFANYMSDPQARRGAYERARQRAGVDEEGRLPALPVVKKNNN